MSLDDVASVVELLVSLAGQRGDPRRAGCAERSGDPTGYDPVRLQRTGPAENASVKRCPRGFRLRRRLAYVLVCHPGGSTLLPRLGPVRGCYRGIIQRRYYSSHGPAGPGPGESRLEAYLGVRNAVAVTNGTLGLYLVALALGLKGKVIMPAFTFIATAQAFLLAGIEPVFCDVDPVTHHMTPEAAEAVLEEGVCAVCAVNLWGGTADVHGLEGWARSHGLPLLFDSAHAFGVQRAEGMVGRFGRAEVFSFHATKVMSASRRRLRLHG